MSGLCARARRTCQLSRLDFYLDGQLWKQVYSTPTCACCSPRALLGARVAVALLWLGCTIWSIADWVGHAEFKYWLTKLTHWSALLELAYFCLAAFSTYRAVSGSGTDGTGRSTPWFVSGTWFLFSFVPTVSFSAFLLYWLLVYEPSKTLKPLSCIMHGGNFALVVVDLLIFRQPFYFAHIYMPIMVGLVYAFFTLFYYLAGGTLEDGTSRYIYTSINWNNPSGTAGLLGLIVVVGLPLLYTVVFCLSGRVCKNIGTGDKMKPDAPAAGEAA